MIVRLVKLVQLLIKVQTLALRNLETGNPKVGLRFRAGSGIGLASKSDFLFPQPNEL